MHVHYVIIKVPTFNEAVVDACARALDKCDIAYEIRHEHDRRYRTYLPTETYHYGSIHSLQSYRLLKSLVSIRRAEINSMLADEGSRAHWDLLHGKLGMIAQVGAKLEAERLIMLP